MAHDRRRIAVALLLAAVLLALVPACAEGGASRPQVLYFFLNYCDACHPEVEFGEDFYALTGRHIEEYAYSWYNVRNEQNRSLFEETAEAYGFAPEDRSLPMAVVDGKAYVDHARLESELPMDFLENKSTDSLIYYLYSPACESCAEAEAAIGALPEVVSARRGSVEFESRVVVKRINIYEDASTARALFDRYGVPEDSRTTPIVFLREDYLRGAESIGKRLPYMLNAALAVGTPLIEPAAEAKAGLLSAAGTALAGFVAGFNPCALSMLLLFLSILLSADRRVTSYAAVYLGAKLVAYIAIGTAFLSVLSAWNPAWLPMAAKLMLTAIGGVLIVLNLMDASAARRERYGDIKNQLPRRLRGFLNERIRRALRGNGVALAASVALLGVVVAASEFLCSGQLYLATLTAGLSAGMEYFRLLMLLVVFCAAFLLPSVIVTLIVTKSRDMFSTSNALLRHMPLIKLLTAAAMLCVILAAWFLV